jgi:hypothetical protein
MLMDTLLERSPPIVAVLAEVPDEIVGWACRELVNPVIHYVYVKHAYRRTGAGTLLAARCRWHTSSTRAGELFFRKIGSLFNPYLLQGAPP